MSKTNKDDTNKVFVYTFVKCGKNWTYVYLLFVKDCSLKLGILSIKCYNVTNLFTVTQKRSVQINIKNTKSWHHEWH